MKACARFQNSPCLDQGRPSKAKGVFFASFLKNISDGFTSIIAKDLNVPTSNGENTNFNLSRYMDLGRLSDEYHLAVHRRSRTRIANHDNIGTAAAETCFGTRSQAISTHKDLVPGHLRERNRSAQKNPPYRGSHKIFAQELPTSTPEEQAFSQAPVRDHARTPGGFTRTS